MSKATCTIEGCLKPHEARGLCASHYQNWKRCGNPLGMRQEQVVRTCSFPGCAKIHSAHGYCGSHARQLRRGEELRPLAVRRPGGGACTVAGCGRPAVARGLCARDWCRWRAHGDPTYVYTKLDRQRAAAEQGRKYALNEAFFDRVETERQAYWLGFIVADGCIIESGDSAALAVELSSRDAGHVERLREDLEAGNPLSFNRTFASLRVGSRRLVEGLACHGVTPRKSLTAKPWDGPAELMPHYWRGMFDGDGSIFQTARDGVWNLTMCGSEACVEAFAEWARGICGATSKAAHHKGGCWRWNVCGGRKPQLLAEALYSGASVALDRKQEKAAELRAVDFEARRAASEARRIAAVRATYASGLHGRAKKP